MSLIMGIGVYLILGTLLCGTIVTVLGAYLLIGEWLIRAELYAWTTFQSWRWTAITFVWPLIFCTVTPFKATKWFIELPIWDQNCDPDSRSE